jgi:hypothetical protein
MRIEATKEEKPMTKRVAKTPNAILKNHPVPRPAPKSPLVRNAIKATPRTVAKSQRIGGARGGSA